MTTRFVLVPPAIWNRPDGAEKPCEIVVSTDEKGVVVTLLNEDPEVRRKAREILERLGFRKIEVYCG